MDISAELKNILPSDRIKTRLIDLLSYASDAGFYHLQPRAVVQVVSEKEIADLFRFSHQNQIPLVFRAGGTSLSGQSITDGILIDLSKYWNRITVENEGARVRVQPGITGSMVNARLRRHYRKIGPDPSSISTALMGGILSNNSSGMCCGVAMNAYHTTRYIRFMLPDGKTFSTENQDDYFRFEDECKELSASLLSFRNEIISNKMLNDQIRSKYQTKNTVGYSLNSFIDYDHPLDIFSHLLIGAEGTLAFIAEAVLETVPDPPHKATALIYFPEIFSACRAIVPLIEANAAMVELMDRASLHAVSNYKGIDPFIKTLDEKAAALLIEFQANSLDELTHAVDAFLAVSSDLNFLNTPVFTSDPVEREFYWKIRKGLFPAVGAVRAAGTTVILEDIAVPVHRLGDTVLDLQELFRKYNYSNAIIFGHAKDGNLHFVVTQSFATTDEINRYDAFLQEVIELVVKKYGGALKAEHGTGRNMAPFVETEWGPDAYRIMKQLKAAADPHALLNPGVIINDDPEAHRKNLKQMPVVESEVDKCIECGYCEPVCPSRNLTMTPRRRIVTRRALSLLKNAGEEQKFADVLKDYQYDGLETCSVDGMCSTACPVDINTGDLVKRLRAENHSDFNSRMALAVSKNFGTVAMVVRTALNIGHGLNSLFGRRTMTTMTTGIRKLIPAFPRWTDQISKPPDLGILDKKRLIGNPTQKSIVYFPACISRLMGSSGEGKKDQVQTFIDVAERAGFNVIIPESTRQNCCSQIFSSKGFASAAAYSANKFIEAVYNVSNDGSFPLVIDVSSCAYTLHHVRSKLTEDNRHKFDGLQILDSVDFLHDMVLPFAKLKKLQKVVALHPVCSLKKMAIENKFNKIASACASSVHVPIHAGCCGMAGDRGFLFPELTASATRPEAIEVSSVDFSGYYSSTKTCEMAMSEATGKNYESILYLVDEAMGRG
ncbi:FAD-binding and (Fe-S)-binding domain-containing protein [Pollutibacter soli]|uniref:FAD-binding and (Fe-S)-binding domain-containing protein n=1 Tax=Pollutibacter soli TaxID=3034157 RepID=UPI003013549A